MINKLHKCLKPIYSDECGNGAAVTEYWEDADSSLWVGNGEYCNEVRYCPFCGYKSKRSEELEK